MRRCCICGCILEGYGNNPEGAMWKTETGEIEEAEFTEADRCCDECNTRYVIPGRLYKLSRQNIKKEEK